MKIVDLMPHGKENTVPMKYLARLMDYEPRAVRLLVFNERRGVPICSTTDAIDGGYYFPESAK